MRFVLTLLAATALGGAALAQTGTSGSTSGGTGTSGSTSGGTGMSGTTSGGTGMSGSTSGTGASGTTSGGAGTTTGTGVTGSSNNAVNPSNTTGPDAARAGTATSPTLEPGSNSFTEGQARSRMEAAGFQNVTDLRKDDQGIWRGKAMRGSQSVSVGVDYKGNVATQ